MVVDFGSAPVVTAPVRDALVDYLNATGTLFDVVVYTPSVRRRALSGIFVTADISYTTANAQALGSTLMNAPFAKVVIAGAIGQGAIVLDVVDMSKSSTPPPAPDDDRTPWLSVAFLNAGAGTLLFCTGVVIAWCSAARSRAPPLPPPACAMPAGAPPKMQVHDLIDVTAAKVGDMSSWSARSGRGTIVMR